MSENTVVSQRVLEFKTAVRQVFDSGLPRRTTTRIAKLLSKSAAEVRSQLATCSAVFDTELRLGEQLGPRFVQPRALRLIAK